MSTDLRTALRAEATKLVDQFCETAMQLFSSQIAGLFSPAPAPTAPTEPPPRSTRVSADEIERALSSTLDLLAKSPRGLRLEQVKQQLGLAGGVLKRAIELGRKEGRINKTGDRRATTYFLSATPSPAQAAGRVVRRKKP